MSVFWRLGMWCWYKILHCSSWVLLSSIRECDSHHVCNVIGLLMSANYVIEKHMRDQGQIYVLGVGMPHWAVVLWANTSYCDIEKCQKCTHTFHAVIKGSWNLTHIYESEIISLFLNNRFFIVILRWYQQCRLYLPLCHFNKLGSFVWRFERSAV